MNELDLTRVEFPITGDDEPDDRVGDEQRARSKLPLALAPLPRALEAGGHDLQTPKVRSGEKEQAG
jgi:hypothetical protein